MTRTAILVLGFNRPKHLSRCLTNVSKANIMFKNDLHIQIDGPRNSSEKIAVEQCYEIAMKFENESTEKVFVSKNTSNQGLAKSVIQGVNRIFEKYQNVIVIEDDLLISSNGINYFQSALEIYEKETKVGSICGYSPFQLNENQNSYFINRSDCWGWATWRDRWLNVEWDGTVLEKKIKKLQREKEFNYFGTFPFLSMLQESNRGLIDSWAIKWQASQFLDGLLSLYPSPSMIANLGHDNSGTHSRKSSDYKTTLDSSTNYQLKKITVEINANGTNQWMGFYSYITRETIFKKCVNVLIKIRNLIKQNIFN